MNQHRMVSPKTRNNWLIDAGLFLSALIASLSGIYFLFLPSNGYMGGRNPWHNVQILFDRHTWDDLHTWGGVVMIAAGLIHLLIHWKWVVGMAKRTINEITGRCVCLNPYGRWNLFLNAVVGVSFVLAALSGLYFLFFPIEGKIAGPQILLTSAAWDWLHTWSSVVMIAAAIIHFAIHWRWVTHVTAKLLRQASPLQPAVQPAISTENSI